MCVRWAFSAVCLKFCAVNSSSIGVYDLADGASVITNLSVCLPKVALQTAVQTDNTSSNLLPEYHQLWFPSLSNPLIAHAGRQAPRFCLLTCRQMFVTLFDNHPCHWLAQHPVTLELAKPTVTTAGNCHPKPRLKAGHCSLSILG